jgi:hypothetical protein
MTAFNIVSATGRLLCRDGTTVSTVSLFDCPVQRQYLLRTQVLNSVKMTLFMLEIWLQLHSSKRWRLRLEVAGCCLRKENCTAKSFGVLWQFCDPRM